ncbi:MAG: hypothetical protein JNK15_13490 [Planctomycetes bacterium]|nr:hypothetical protein [Planctomycetota bacterium]
MPAGTEQRQRASVPVRRAAAKPLRLEVPDVAQPGGSVRCVATAGAGDLVTFAVVDDRLFRLRPDPTRTPDEALRPHVPKPSWSIHRSPECDDARLVFGGLLVDGRVPAPGDLSESTPSAGGASGPAGAAAAGGGELRSDFRATACFRTVVADASGRAVLEFAVPDDVTTWRVTATAVDGEGEGTLARAMFAARLPLAAEVLLPRVLRVGDRVEVPLVLDRAAHAMGDDTVRLEVAAEGALRHDGAAAVAAVVARGDVRTVTILLSAPQAGEGVVRCAATHAANVDRSERRVPVAADGVAATVANAAAGRGVVAVDVPAERSPGAPVQVDVLAGGAAAWRQLADRLQEYPYGCVEQTLSRLLPFAAGGAVAGDPVLRADRIGKGMARLRQLQCGRSGPFAFWPGGDADLAMTGLVLHGLAALRAGGVDAAAYGLRIDQAALLAQATNAADATSFAALELLAGLLRYSPDDAAVRAAVAARVDAAAPMPRGTALRLGLALSAAGDRARAQRCRQGLPTGAEAPGFPGSDPTVHLAHELELDRALGAAIAPQREMELVRELLGSGCRTYTDAVALLALAPGLGNGGADVPVEIVVDGGAATPLRLTSAGGMQGRQRLDGGRRIEVRTADARELLFVRVAATTLRRGNGPAWAAPFVVERQLSGPGVVVGVDGVAAVRVGERVRVALRLETPVRARYVAVVCPLPAGWELLGDAPWLQRFDDRVVFAWPDLAAHGVRTFTFDVVPTVAGAVAWPPVVAEAMYEPTQTGGSEGCRVQVLPREAAAPAPVVLPFLLAAPAAVATPVAAPATVSAPPSLDERLAAAAATIESVWFEAVLPRGIYGFDDAPADEARAKLAAALQLLEASAADEPKSVVRHLPVPMSREQRPRGATLAPWRRELLARLWQLQERCLESTLADCERHLATEPDHAAVETAVRALPASRAEALAQRALALLWPTNVGAVENLVDALPVELRDERLQMQLVAMLASGEPEFAVEVVSRLPEHWLADVAPGALVQALPNLYDEHTRTVVRVLQRTAPGRRALRAMLADPELAGGLPVELWPDEACTGLPASAWARMAEDDGARARALLAGGAVPVPTLWQWLLARGDGVPLEVLAMALWDRGEAPPADVMAAPTADPTVMALRALLAARHDAARLEAALAAARPLFAAEAGDDVEEVVTTVVGKLVGAHGDVAAVREFARALAPSDWRAVWRRMPAAAAPVLLQLDDDFGYGLPTTDEVLGRLLQRAFDRGDLRDAVLAIGAEPEGLTRLLAVRAQSAAARRADLDDALHRLGLDPASGGAAADASSFVLPFAAHGAWDGTWPPSLQVARDDLLSFRGLR